MSRIKKLAYAGVCLAIAILLPFLTANIPEIGKQLCPMHLPVMLCGFLLGPVYGGAVGFIAPVLKSFLTGTPVLFPNGVGMAFELFGYGFLCGLFYGKLPKKPIFVYVSLVLAMIGGRLIWATSRFLISSVSTEVFTFEMFIAGGITSAIPGIIAQIILVPIIVFALEKAGIMGKENLAEKKDRTN